MKAKYKSQYKRLTLQERNPFIHYLKYNQYGFKHSYILNLARAIGNIKSIHCQRAEKMYMEFLKSEKETSKLKAGIFEPRKEKLSEKIERIFCKNFFVKRHGGVLYILSECPFEVPVNQKVLMLHTVITEPSEQVKWLLENTYKKMD